MKKLFPYILIVSIIVQLLAPFSVDVGVKNNLEVVKNKAEAVDCTIEEESFTAPTPLPTSITTPRPESITYTIKSSNCVGYLVNGSVQLFSSGGSPSNVYLIPSQRISENNFSFTLKTGDKSCDFGDCNDVRIKFTIFDDSATTILSKVSHQSLAFACTDGTCNDNETWDLISRTGTQLPSPSNCKITNVSFDPPTKITPNVFRPDSIDLVVSTSGCENQLISDSTIKVGGFWYDMAVWPLAPVKINSNDVVFKLKTGEEGCDGKACDKIIVDLYIRDATIGTILLHYKSNKADGSDKISYNCKGSGGNCDESEWGFISVTGADQSAGSSTTTNVYFYELTHSDGTITPSANFTTEELCKIERDVVNTNKPEGITSVSECKSQTVQQTTAGSKLTEQGDLPKCSIIAPTLIGGCFAQGFYYALFKPSSLVFALSGRILDFTLMYSIDDTSYRSTFVVEGWGLMRDFCNMFFIFVLLYIAFGTILGLHSVKTKEMIINVVIIGLLINFSLFATQVIIDASNILTRVFYNSNTISMQQKDNLGNPFIKVGPNGEIPLSEAIVSKVNPQELIIKASEVEKIPIRGTLANEEQETTPGGISVGTFIIVTLLATVVNVVGTIAFLSSALIFIGRVLMLWLAMILAPLAFFSYTVPALQDMEMVGWKKWWPDTLKMAFVAPIFTFFMYLIVGFMDKGLGIVNASMKTGAGGLNFIIAIVVPFAFIMILLMKAKSIAVDMSGEVGATLSKVGASVGGAGLALATGGAAMAMRGTVGKLGGKLNNAGWVNRMAGGNNLFSKFVGNKLKDVGQGVGKSSFDVRATKLGGLAGKGMDVDMGKAKEGGYIKDREDKVKKEQKRASEIKVNEDEELTQDVNKLEMDLQILLNRNAHNLEAIDKRLISARQDATDINSKETTDPAKLLARKTALAVASAMSTATPDDVARKTAAIAAANAMDVDDPVKILAKKNANDKVAELKDIKTAIKKGSSYTETILTAAPGTTPRGIVSFAGNRINGRTIDELESTAIPDAHSKKQEESRRRTTNYANNLAFWDSRANDEAQHKIIMETKLDSGAKT